SLLHVMLRRIETGAAKEKLIFDVRRVSGERKRVFLRGFIPLLRLLVLQAFFEVAFTFFRKHNNWHKQQTQHEHDGSNGSGFHGSSFLSCRFVDLRWRAHESRSW